MSQVIVARSCVVHRASPHYAVKGAIIYCAVVLGSVVPVYRCKLLSPFSAFLLMGLGASVSSAILLIRLKPVLRLRMGRLTCGTVGQRHWQYGRWVLASLT